jgi:hypothetical protein
MSQYDSQDGQDEIRIYRMEDCRFEISNFKSAISKF